MSSTASKSSRPEAVRITDAEQFSAIKEGDLLRTANPGKPFLPWRQVAKIGPLGPGSFVVVNPDDPRDDVLIIDLNLGLSGGVTMEWLPTRPADLNLEALNLAMGRIEDARIALLDAAKALDGQVPATLHGGVLIHMDGCRDLNARLTEFVVVK